MVRLPLISSREGWSLIKKWKAPRKTSSLAYNVCLIIQGIKCSQHRFSHDLKNYTIYICWKKWIKALLLTAFVLCKFCLLSGIRVSDGTDWVFIAMLHAICDHHILNWHFSFELFLRRCSNEKYICMTFMIRCLKGTVIRRPLSPCEYVINGKVINDCFEANTLYVFDWKTGT